jgi:hypothetical protein
MIGGRLKPPRTIGLATLVFAASTAAVLPAPASAVVKGDRAGDAKAGGITAAERRALDLVRVEAIGEAGGLVVTATFRGDVAQRIGRGNLRRAVVGLVLRPKRGARASATAAPTRPALLATTGPTGRAKTISKTRSRSVAAVRRGREVTFFILGSGLENVGRLEVKTIVSPGHPRGRARAAVNIPYIMFGDLSVDNVFFRPPNVIRDCSELRELIKAAERILNENNGAFRLSDDADELEDWLEQAKREYRLRPCFDPGGGGSRACEFGFDANSTNSASFLIQFGCNQSFGNAVFDFNAPLQSVSPEVGNAPSPTCQVDSTDTSVVRCNGSFEAGQVYLFEARAPGPQSCPGFIYVPAVEGQAFPEKSCR